MSHPYTTLTTADHDLLAWLADGATQRATALALGTTVRTVVRRLAQLRRIIGSATTADLVQWYVAHSVLAIYEVTLYGGIGWSWQGVFDRRTGVAVCTEDAEDGPSTLRITRRDERTVWVQGAGFATPVIGDWMEQVDKIHVVLWVET